MFSDFLFDQLYPASFNGVSFLYISGTVNGGRKTVTHEYPNQDVRYVEDLGKMPRSFTINGIITGALYREEKKLLEIALNAPGTGILVHPFYGNVQCAITTYTVDEDTSALGAANFTMNFLESGEALFPLPVRDNIGEIADLYAEIYSFVENDLNEQYLASYTKNISVSALKLQDLSKTLEDIGDNTEALKTSDTDFKEESRNFSANSYKIAAPDGNIGGNVSSLISSFDSLTTDGNARFAASQKLLGFGENDIFVVAQTAQVIERQNNQKLTNGTINALAYTNMVDAAKLIDYQDEDELNEFWQKVDDAADYLANSTTLLFSNELADEISEIRNQSRVFFNQERLVVNKIIEIETETTPMAVLAFKYYGDTDNYDELLSLNGIFNPSRVSGTVKILEA